MTVHDASTPGSCDTLVSLPSASAGGQVLFAKNSDRPADEAQPLELHHARPDAAAETQFVHVEGSGPAYRHIGSRPYWCRGYEHGFNERQVVIGNEALPSRLPESEEPKLVGMEVLRLALERGSTAAAAVDVITGLVEKYGQGRFANDAGVRTYDNIFLVADPSSAFVVETVGHEWAVSPIPQASEARGTHSISNVGRLGTGARVSPGAEAQAVEHGLFDPEAGRPFDWSAAYADRAASESGVRRQARSSALLEHHAGELDFGKMMLILSDHGAPDAPADAFVPSPGARRGICTHPQHDGGATAASLVADLCADGSRLPVYWCGMYTPCTTLFLPVFIEGELPAELSIGGETATADSPWWMFHALAESGFSGGPERMKEVHEGWWGLQKGLFGSAYEMAARGREMIDDGEGEAAAQMLTRYMANNVGRMLDTGRELLRAGSPAMP